MLLQRLLRIARNTKIVERSLAHKSTHFPLKVKKQHVSSAKLFIASSITPMGIWSFVKKESSNETVMTTKEVLLSKADALFDQGQYRQIYDLLSKYMDMDDVEILWRICRAVYNMSKSASEVEAKNLIYEGYDLICKAHKLKEDSSAVHKWMVIFIDAKTNYEGMKARIQELNNMKNHLMRAIELNETDAMTLYMLGNWCFQVSNLAWYQRKIATIVFAEPPTSSFEEALKYLEKAEEVDPNFYSHNLLMLGKTYLKLNRKEKGLEYLKRAAEYPARTDDDHKAQQEAQKLLNDL